MSYNKYSLSPGLRQAQVKIEALQMQQLFGVLQSCAAKQSTACKFPLDPS